MTTRAGWWVALLLTLLGPAGCFYPPPAKPLAEATNQVVLHLPYDLAWHAVKEVVKQNGYRVSALDPNYGIIQTQAGPFTLRVADCGQLKGVATKYNAEPDIDSSTVYNFYVKPDGPEASIVRVEATFLAALHVPLHTPRPFQCVSRGVEEFRLLTEIREQADKTHRQSFGSSAN